MTLEYEQKPLLLNEVRAIDAQALAWAKRLRGLDDRTRFTVQALMVELLKNQALLHHECNEHRAARGYEPLPEIKYG